MSRFEEIKDSFTGWIEEKSKEYGPDWPATTTYFKNMTYLISRIEAAEKLAEALRYCASKGHGDSKTECARCVAIKASEEWESGK